MRRLVQDARTAREDRGLTQEDVGRAIGVSRSRFSRIEGAAEDISLVRISSWLAVVGLELSARAFPAGAPIRDAAHVALLARLHTQLHPALRWRTEVPMPIPGDLRAWDAVISGAEWALGVEAETRPTDAQALERRVALKCRDSGIEHALLLLADTRHNRAFGRSSAVVFGASFPGDGRRVVELLRRGMNPGVSTIVFL